MSDRKVDVSFNRPVKDKDQSRVANKPYTPGELTDTFNVNAPIIPGAHRTMYDKAFIK